LSDGVVTDAERLLFRHALRASDAVHIGSALILARTLPRSVPLLTADARMADAPTAEGLDVERFIADGE
jgi:hypothetical protein